LSYAGSTYEQALAIAREIGDRRGESNMLANLASALLKQGKTVEARELCDEEYRKALGLSAEAILSRNLPDGGLRMTYWFQDKIDELKFVIEDKAASQNVRGAALAFVKWAIAWYGKRIALRRSLALISFGKKSPISS
jgi:hypothetical protein